ncbi:unnamed protein product [Durusdinium trenchii]|uniref:Protein kinase domain-containing protein n=1 Tax=Durusdinium trenchii TaxID=1381693 RepID=A0ABP0M289_9DINO
MGTISFHRHGRQVAARGLAPERAEQLFPKRRGRVPSVQSAALEVPRNGLSRSFERCTFESMNRAHSTPSIASDLSSSPSRRPPLASPTRERRVPCLDGLSSPFTELSLARQNAMRLPPLERLRDGRWSAPVSREGEAMGSLDVPAAPASAPPKRKKRQVSTGGLPHRTSSDRLSRGSRCSSSTSVGSDEVVNMHPLAIPIGSFGWVRGSSIGQGAHACVFKALERSTGRIFAVKQSPWGGEADEKFRERLEEELRICKDLRHPNIVACLGFECSRDSFYIYLEYVPGGSMSTLLKEFGPLEGRLLKQCSEGVLEGLNYLHTRDPPVVHRDIKGANILVDLSFNVKLSDFGCSKKEDLTKSFTTIGSIPWMAPEVILQRDGYGRKADVWSFGCAVLEMATAEKPWGKDAFENVMYALKHISMTDAIPPIPEMDEVEIFSPLTRTENGNENKVFLVNGNGNKALSEAQACVILQRWWKRRREAERIHYERLVLELMDLRDEAALQVQRIWRAILKNRRRRALAGNLGGTPQS